MAVVKNEATSSEAPAVDKFDAENTPGFHVLIKGDHVGTFQTKADAQSFIDQHLAPQGLSAKIVEGAAE